MLEGVAIIDVAHIRIDILLCYYIHLVKFSTTTSLWETTSRIGKQTQIDILYSYRYDLCVSHFQGVRVMREVESAEESTGRRSTTMVLS